MARFPELNTEPSSHSFQFSLRSFLIAIALLAGAMACVRCNVLWYLYARSLEHQFRHSHTDVRPWLWPEDALGAFVLGWMLSVVASVAGLFWIRDKLLKLEIGFFAAGAFIAALVNAYFFLVEAFTF